MHHSRRHNAKRAHSRPTRHATHTVSAAALVQALFEWLQDTFYSALNVPPITGACDRGPCVGS